MHIALNTPLTPRTLNAPLPHIVFVAGPSWSHLRPFIKTILRLVNKFPDLYISIFISVSLVPQHIWKEYFQPSTHAHRIQIIPSHATNEKFSRDPLKFIAGLEHKFRSWITAQLEHPSTEIKGSIVNKPSWIVEDIDAGGIALSCKDVHGLPIIAWWSCPAAALIARYGNEDNGHGSRVFNKMADRRDKGEQIVYQNATVIFLRDLSDRLVCIPGIPAHYEYEQITQLNTSIPHDESLSINRRMNVLKNIDYLACCTTYEMEPISAESLAQALHGPITPFFIGPGVDIPSQCPRAKPTTPVSEFLDQAYAELGAHSVIYVAFGSCVFPFPSSVRHLTIILEEIVAQGFRLVLALSSAHARWSRLDSEWMDKLFQSGNAMFPEWTDQTTILEHPAIHYFLSHGGWNSSTEALVRGVPMIFWPFVWDQPFNAIQIATLHNAGFELLQVRTGPAHKTAYRSGKDIVITGTEDAVREEITRILEMSRVGHQRLNARLLGQVLARSLSPGGSADVDLEKLGKLMGLGS